MLAAELVQTCRAMSRAVLPPIVQYTPPSAVGIAPSTTAMYCALMLPNHSFESCFGLFARARHDQFVVFPGEKIKHEFSNGWVAGAQHRFRVARAILKFEPNQDRTRRLTESFFDG